MNLAEIKGALAEGKRVYWKNESYEVIHDDIGRFLIRCYRDGSCIGLTWRDGVTLNGAEIDFFVRIEPREGT